MILADTSVWVELDRGQRSPLAERLLDAINHDAARYTEPVAMELLAGSGEANKVRRLLGGIGRVHFERDHDFLAAGWLYRECAKRGTAPRGFIDCLIAAVAIRSDVPLLAHDRDFGAIAEVAKLRLIAA